MVQITITTIITVKQSMLSMRQTIRVQTNVVSQTTKYEHRIYIR